MEQKGGDQMTRTVGIGHQDFETIQREGYFYVDKTKFIRNGGRAEIL